MEREPESPQEPEIDLHISFPGFQIRETVFSLYRIYSIHSLRIKNKKQEVVVIPVILVILEN